MPFITAPAPHSRQTRQLLANQAAEQAKRERSFKIMFVTLVLLSVAVVSFLVAVYGLR